jgi:hypothetical protein
VGPPLGPQVPLLNWLSTGRLFRLTEFLIIDDKYDGNTEEELPEKISK